MSKKIISLLLSLMLVASMIAVAAVSVSAEEDDDNKYSTIDSSDNDILFNSDFLSSEDADETTADPVVAPATLTVNATSNYFPKATAEYNEETKEVTVTYWIKSSQKILDLQWELTYDTEVLTYSKKNNYASISPVIAENAIMNEIEPGFIKYNALSLRLFDFVSSEAPFAQIVFDVNDISDKAPVTTTVDLTVDVLRVSEIDPSTLMSDSSKEVVLVDFYKVIENDKTAEVTVDRRTSLTPSTYVAPTTAAPTTTVPVTDPVTSDPVTEPTTVPVTTVDPGENILNLTVNATSNYFPEATAEYNKTTNEVVVRYWLQSAQDVLDLQWYLTYDSSILTLSDKNTPDSICPVIGSSSVMNTGIKETIKYNATNLSLFKFTEADTTFAEIVFDVNDLTDTAPVTTTIDLVVEVLRVSKVDPETLRSDVNEEVIIVDNCEVLTDDRAVAAIVDKGTTLTPSTYFVPTEPTTEPTTAPATDPVTDPATDPVTDPTTVTDATTDPVVTDPSTDPVVTDPTTTEPVETTVPSEINPDDINPTSADSTSVTDTTVKPDSSSNDNNTVQTGDASMAVVILSILVAATGVMFVMRKKETF